jgi:hypothetical protein
MPPRTRNERGRRKERWGEADSIATVYLFPSSRGLCEVNSGSSTLRKSRYRNTGEVYFFFMGAPHVQRGFTPSPWLSVWTKTTAWQEMFVQCQVSPERIIIAGLHRWEQECLERSVNILVGKWRCKRKMKKFSCRITAFW